MDMPNRRGSEDWEVIVRHEAWKMISFVVVVAFAARTSTGASRMKLKLNISKRCTECWVFFFRSLLALLTTTINRDGYNDTRRRESTSDINSFTTISYPESTTQLQHHVIGFSRTREGVVQQACTLGTRGRRRRHAVRPALM